MLNENEEMHVSKVSRCLLHFQVTEPKGEGGYLLIKKIWLYSFCHDKN